MALGWVKRRHSRPAPHILTRVYADDRSFATSHIWSLHEMFHQWSSWSWSVGQPENQVKTLAVASSPARRATLRRVLPDAVRNDVEILGSCSMVTRRGLLGKEALVCIYIYIYVCVVGLPVCLLSPCAPICGVKCMSPSSSCFCLA